MDDERKLKVRGFAARTIHHMQYDEEIDNLVGPGHSRNVKQEIEFGVLIEVLEAAVELIKKRR